jgi:hypothetical protein
MEPPPREEWPAAGPEVPLPGPDEALDAPCSVPARVQLPVRFPDPVQAIADGCGVVREILGRARLGRTLTVRERHVIVQVFAHLGEEGRLFAHQVLAQGEGYEPDLLNRDLKSVSPHAIGCRRIDQLIPGLKNMTGCLEPAGLPDDAYPSPLCLAGIVPRTDRRLPGRDRPTCEPAVGALVRAAVPRLASARDPREIEMVARLLEERLRLLRLDLENPGEKHGPEVAPLRLVRTERSAPERTTEDPTARNDPPAAGEGGDGREGRDGV